MIIKIRPESFGYIAFDKRSRKHRFVTTDLPASTLARQDMLTQVGKIFDCTDEDIQLEFVGDKVRQRLSAPLCLYLEITRYCTLRCNHCYKPEDPLSQAMDLDDFTKLLKDARDMGIFEVRLCGNEPTISPIFFEVCQQIQNLGLFLSINTSGIMNARTRRRLIDIRPDHVVVSVDGNQATHDAIRKPGAYAQAVELLHALQEANIQRRINCVISGLTMNHMDEVIALAKEVGCGISFIPLRTMGRSTEFKDEFALTPKSMYQAVSHITAQKQAVPEVPLETFFDILGNGFWAHHTMEINIPCPAGKNGFVSADGTFYPCDWLRYMEGRFACGNVRQSSLAEIWEKSTTLQAFRQIVRKKCLDCTHYLKTCYGGCWCSYQESMDCGEYEDKLCFAPLISAGKMPITAGG